MNTAEVEASRQDVQQAFPPPPPYYKDFAPRENDADEQILPAPPPPVEGEYHFFGELHTTEDGIPPLTVRPLFTVSASGSVDFRKELIKLNKELLFCYLDLIDTLIERPSAYARSVEHVGVVARNMHYLLNTLRGHQARATLEHMLQKEIAEGRKAVKELREAANVAHELVKRGDTIAGEDT